MPSSGRDRWILRAPKQANPMPGSRLRLFCFPPAGTGAWAYHGWGPGLPADIEILPVELPGRNSRAGEPAMEAMAPLVAEVVEAVTPLMRERPFVLFGHSMGAWVAYEVALALARAGGPTPAKAYFSGCRPPHLNGAEHDVDPTRLGDLTYKEFWPAFEKRYGKVPGLEEEIIREYVYPVLRADFRLVEAYQPTGGPVQEGGGLPCPIAALCGEEDGRLHRAQLELWKCHTKAGFQEVWFPNSDHRYISDHPDKLLQFLSKDLTTLL
ncbi:unnamed protein product [Ostreobium quekettii]|uniref:Thioesterase domain-containing protein n=1 Tax=Ostreobium quekettii TaxID=121088 RepID=A0A8S1J4W5_9CHLO|nr:unnamed protein product [Ostreobium quekettii]